MRHSETIRRRSGGFTLIEVMVVITILAVLAGLLMAAIAKAKEVGLRTQTKAEIGQIGIAIENFKSTHHVGYVPSCLWITNNYNASPGSVALADSRQYISRVWPKALNANNVPGTTYWPAGPTQLDGNQVLVLLLGGMPPTRQGFYNSPTNPFQIPADGSLGRAFYDFKVDRIDSNGHYLDFYGAPYLYFSSVNGSDYDYFGKRYYDRAPDGSQNPDPARIGGMTLEGGYGDPNSNTQMKPLRGLDGKYINPNGFQLISMGRDNRAGRGSPCNSWGNPAAPWPLRPCTNWTLYDAGIDDYSPGNLGGDDIANFGTATLGSIP